MLFRDFGPCQLNHLQHIFTNRTILLIAKLSWCQIVRCAKLSGAKLSGAKLSGAKLSYNHIPCLSILLPASELYKRDQSDSKDTFKDSLRNRGRDQRTAKKGNEK